jgi:predicted RNA-binding Zn ribbon-like protein
MDTEPEPSNPPAAFDLSGGQPALDLVNSLDQRFGAEGPVELLAGYGDLLRFTAQTGLLDAPQAHLLARSVSPGAGARALRAARELREAMAASFYGYLDGRPPPPAALRTLERHFRNAARHRELGWEPAAQVGHGRMRWQWARLGEQAELPVWLLAQAGSELMLSGAMERVRACGAESCRWLFLDTSKNHTRRWCNMKVCGNRMKARRFQARHAGQIG